MSTNHVADFLSPYSKQVLELAWQLREVLLANLPNVQEQIDIPAKMIAYGYGQKYVEMVCTIFPSKNRVKLGFYKGVDLPDPNGLLEGTGKISRYVVVKSVEQIKSAAIQQLIANAFAAYQERMNIK